MLILQRGQYDKIAESVQFTYSHKSTVLQAIKQKAVNLLLCNPNPKTIVNSMLHCKKRLAIFPSPAGMSLTKLSLARNNFMIPGQGEFG